jgi:hypothetical protein
MDRCFIGSTGMSYGRREGRAKSKACYDVLIVFYRKNFLVACEIAFVVCCLRGRRLLFQA